MPEDQGSGLTVEDEEFFKVNVAETGPPEKGTFEVGLVLAGTVSAGAYTAGFVDFLIEALDQYEALGIDGQGTKPHKLKLKVIAGTSGGGMVAAQMGRALYRDYQPVDFDATHEDARQNTFFASWVDGIDISHLTRTDDLDGIKRLQGMNSLLNSRRIESLARGTLDFMADGDRFRHRPWVDDELHVIMTHFNMRGVPYRVPYAEIGGEMRYQSFREHADHLRFQIFADQVDQGRKRGDSFHIEAGSARYPDIYALSAIGTGAFPGALKAPLLSRPLRHYLLRGHPVPRVTGKTSIERLELDAVAMKNAGFVRPGQIYDYVVVDGGVANNEPLELARTTLAGMTGRNPREATKANRAVIMVAPLHTQAALPVDRPMNIEASAQIMDVLPNMLGSVRRQMTFSTADIALAGNLNVHSRFMVLPSRMRIDGTLDIGEQAIACSGLEAFLGFLDRRYRLHDYRLGRRNAWQFLKNEFWLDSANEHVFDGWSNDQIDAHKEPYRGRQYLPLVPLVGTAKEDPGLPAWPGGGIQNRSKVEDQIRERVRAVLDIQPLKDPDGSWFNLGNAAAELGERLAEGVVMDWIKDKIDATLDEKGLNRLVR